MSLNESKIDHVDGNNHKRNFQGTKESNLEASNYDLNVERNILMEMGGSSFDMKLNEETQGEIIPMRDIVLVNRPIGREKRGNLEQRNGEKQAKWREKEEENEEEIIWKEEVEREKGVRENEREIEKEEVKDFSTSQNENGENAT